MTTTPTTTPTTTTALEVRLGGRTVTVATTRPVPGLHTGRHPHSGLWLLLHHSGMPLAVAETEADAERAALEVADFADWTRPAEVLRADAALDLGVLGRMLAAVGCVPVGSGAAA